MALNGASPRLPFELWFWVTAILQPKQPQPCVGGFVEHWTSDRSSSGEEGILLEYPTDASVSSGEPFQRPLSTSLMLIITIIIAITIIIIILIRILFSVQFLLIQTLCALSLG